MAKMSAWIITVIGAILVLAKLGIDLTMNGWLIPLLVLALGVTKLLRSYKLMKI